jgi:outer membrane protein assembly factor BamB
MRLNLPAIVAFAALLPSSTVLAADPDWSRFRGPNGSGVSAAENVPTEFGPSKNLLWRLPLPPGHSSPMLIGDRIYLTAYRGDTLVTIAIDRVTGRQLWERSAPQVKTKVVDKRNNPASPSPAVERDGVYVFFPDYGLIAYDAAGKERWKLPLGPFTNIYGMGSSPVIVGDIVVLACDQSLGSYIMAVNKRTGRVVWKVERPEAKSGHATPILWRGPDGKDQILVPGSFLLTAYDVATGRKLWWVGGLSFEIKSTPVIGGDTIYVNGYGRRLMRCGKPRIATATACCRKASSPGTRRRSGSTSPISIRTARSRGTSGPTTAPRSTPRTACSRSSSAAPAT